ncbi:MAG: M20 family metallopeptidase [Candidatus Omnitrophota bacterium]
MIDGKIRKNIRQYLQSQRKEMIEWTQRLCAFATENPPGRDYAPCVDFLDAEARSAGLKTKIIRVPLAIQKQLAPPETWDYPRLNLIARWNVRASQTLHFNGHYDVVPVSSDWKTDPYAPVVKSKKLYGRGTSDMKGCLAAMIYAVKALRTCGLQPAWNLELSFTCDEEIGGECGAGYIVKNKIVRPDAAVVCEGGSEDLIAYGHRGVFWADATVFGVSGHGSTPSSGVNAFEKGMRLAERFRAMHERVSDRQSAYVMSNPEYKHPSLTMGGLAEGGAKVNTIPDRFHFTIDRRLIPEENIAQVQSEFEAEIREMKKEDKRFKAKLETIEGFNAGITNPNSSICKIAQEAVSGVLGREAKLLLFGAFTDLHFFTNQGRCPTIGYGVSGNGIHSSREYLDIPSLVDTAAVYAEIALRMPR